MPGKIYSRFITASVLTIALTLTPLLNSCSKKHKSDCFGNLVTIIKYKVFLESYASFEDLILDEANADQSAFNAADRNLYIYLKEGNNKYTQRLESLIRNSYELDALTQPLGLLAQIATELNDIPDGYDCRKCIKNIDKENFGLTENKDEFRREFITEIQASKARYGRSVESNQELDDRVEFNDVKKILAKHFGNAEKNKLLKVEKNWTATVVITHKDSLDTIGANQYLLPGSPAEEVYNICLSDSFSQQLSTAIIGTGFFVSNNKVVSAGHVIIQETMDFKFEDLRFITNFDITSKMSNQKNGYLIEARNIFKIKENAKLNEKHVFGRNLSSNDWAIAEIEPIVKNPDSSEHTSVAISNEPIFPNTPLYSIGYGLGLPKKLIFDGAPTLFPTDENYFRCNLDLFGGNSGSPVFNAITHDLVGFCRAGEEDFIFKDSCYVYAVYYSNQYWGRGEDIQYIDHEITQHIPMKNTTSNRATPCTKRADTAGTKRDFAPYCYLQHKQKEFRLFVISPTPAGKTLKLCNPDRKPIIAGNKRIFNFEKTSSNNPNNDYFEDYLTFSVSQVDTYEVVINIKEKCNSPNPTFYSIIVSTQADTFIDADIENKIAYNRPYTYLSAPEVPGSPRNCSHPYVILPIKGYDPTDVTETIPPSSRFDCISSIKLNKKLAGKKDIFIPKKINEHFYQYDRSDKLFDYEVLDENNQALGRRKTKNKNADTKPKRIRRRR